MTNILQSSYPSYANAYENTRAEQPLPSTVEGRTQFAMGNNILLSMKDITAHCNLSDKYFYALIKRGQFPRPLKLGRASRWRKSDYEAWLNKRNSSN